MTFHKLFLLAIILCFRPFSPDVTTTAPGEKAGRKALFGDAVVRVENGTKALYEDLGLEEVISFPAFEEAVRGYLTIQDRKEEILTLIDFSKPSNSKRLAVVDMKHGRVLYTSVVSHGQGSGGLYATKFSNRDGSHQSSLGFYLTGGTYNGSNGYSLKLIGLEKGFNDNALSRAIVMHGADYCSESVVGSSTRLGRSWGCPAVPRSLSRPIINAIKGGSVLFIYAKNSDYLAHSPILTQAGRDRYL